LSECGAEHRRGHRALYVEVAPIRVNLIAAGFLDTPLSASLLGDGLEARREELAGCRYGAV
jgi:NAD(P)-dependent dehydrogenase (short-subunit alcohol dehydrogenase family)